MVELGNAGATVQIEGLTGECPYFGEYSLDVLETKVAGGTVTLKISVKPADILVTNTRIIPCPPIGPYEVVYQLTEGEALSSIKIEVGKAPDHVMKDRHDNPPIKVWINGSPMICHPVPIDSN